MRIYQQFLVTDLDEKQVYGTVWLDKHTLEVDQNNMPRASDIAIILKALATSELKARATGSCIEVEYDE